MKFYFHGWQHALKLEFDLKSYFAQLPARRKRDGIECSLAIWLSRPYAVDLYQLPLWSWLPRSFLPKKKHWLKPILTGGGGVNLTPPVQNPRLPRDRRRSRHAFSWVFSFKSYASFDTKFAKIGPSVARSHDVLYSHVGIKFAQNLHFAYVCVQNTWKLLIFLKCTKTLFILSFWPFAQFLISWN